MKQILVLLLIFLSILLGCSKEEISSEPIITADVVEEIQPEIKKEEIEENITTLRFCHDTDNGIIRWVNGTIFGFYNNAVRFEFNDYCFDNNILIEYYCENEIPKNTSFLCKNGCNNSHCI